MEERLTRFEAKFDRFVEYVEARFQELPTREEWSQFATKADLERFATKADLQDEFGSLRSEMRERFELVHDRLTALEKRRAV